jgi:hypothetical protein
MIVSDDFPLLRRPRFLLIIQNDFPFRFAHFELGAHFLHACGENSRANIADRKI